MENKTQNNFLLSTAAKEMKPQQLKWIKLDEAYERLKDIRFGWTEGKEVCPYCSHERVYEYASRSLFKCAKCGKQFSLTSGTVLNGAKTSYKDTLMTISMKVHGFKLVHIATETGLNYRGLWNKNKKLRLFTGNIKPRDVDLRYPFIQEGAPKLEGEDLVSAVAGLTKELPDQVRADVAQEMILGVLSGEISDADLAANVKLYIRKYYSSYDNRFSHLSWESSVPGTDGGRFDDLISTEDSIWNSP